MHAFGHSVQHSSDHGSQRRPSKEGLGGHHPADGHVSRLSGGLQKKLTAGLQSVKDTTRGVSDNLVETTHRVSEITQDVGGRIARSASSGAEMTRNQAGQISQKTRGLMRRSPDDRAGLGHGERLTRTGSSSPSSRDPETTEVDNIRPTGYARYPSASGFSTTFPHGPIGMDDSFSDPGSPSGPASLSYSRSSTAKPIEEMMEADLRNARCLGDRLRPAIETPTRRALIAAAKLSLQEETQDTLNLQRDSVYTAAVLMPQFARSAGWPGQLNALAARSYFFLALNISLQWFFLYLLRKEDLIMDVFSGQMYLCDFGASSECPDGPGCIGPGGTRISPSRLYSWTQWSTRVFVKESLLVLFPDKAEYINDAIDPGEYGVESTHCRLLCTFIFVMTTLVDLYEVMSLLHLLYGVPSSDDSWMDYDEDRVILRMAGMPRHWKCINVIVVALPKFLLWLLTLRSGVGFIMDTSGIDDTIVNTTALGFILTIDELMFETITTAQTRDMMETVTDYKEIAAEESYDRLLRHDIDEVIEISKVRKCRCKTAFPWKLALCAFITFCFVADYYVAKCVRSEDGTLVSRDVHKPMSTSMFLLSGALPELFPVASEEEVYWSMPSKEHAAR